MAANRGKSIALAFSLVLLSSCRATTYDDALNFRREPVLYQAALRSAAEGGDAKALVTLAGELATTPEADEWLARAENLGSPEAADAALDGHLAAPDARITALGWLVAADLPSAPGPRTAVLAATMPEQQVATAQQWAETYFSQYFALPYEEGRLWRGQRAVLRLR